MNDIYLISGLGADERLFGFLNFHNRKTIFIKWITPLPNESIEHYAERLRAKITFPRPILIGVSFGGMMAIEIARQMETEKVILISSAKGRSELPFYFRLAGTLKLYKLLPIGLLKRSHLLMSWLFGPQKKSEKELLRSIIQDSDPVFTKWAVGKVLTWANKTKIENLKHIHGTADKTLPIHFVKADKKILHGEHFMIISQADEVSNAINKFL